MDDLRVAIGECVPGTTLHPADSDIDGLVAKLLSDKFSLSHVPAELQGYVVRNQSPHGKSFRARILVLRFVFPVLTM